MTELPLIFLGGLLGSSHCIGMCGPLALALGAHQRTLRANLGRQLLFSAGRIFTYSFGGAVAAFFGWWLARRPSDVVDFQAALAIAAGVALVAIGLHSTGLLPPLRIRFLTIPPCTAAQWLKALLTGPGVVSPLLAGVFTGFIPCGLVYAFLAYAAATGNVLEGWLTMVVFGLGTLPLMVLAGSGGTLLSLAARARAMQLAAWCVVATGLICVFRGTGFISMLNGTAGGGCPFCR